MILPTVINGRTTFLKDPDDQRRYKIDVSGDLTEMATTAASVIAIVAGVSILEAATVNGSVMIVKLGGLDVSTNPVNYCTFRITCANGEVFDRTIWFIKVDN
jgi:hypothetical protein